MGHPKLLADYIGRFGNNEEKVGTSSFHLPARMRFYIPLLPESNTIALSVLGQNKTKQGSAQATPSECKSVFRRKSVIVTENMDSSLASVMAAFFKNAIFLIMQ